MRKQLRGEDRLRLIVALTLLALLGATLTALAVTGYLKPFLLFLVDLFKSKERMREYVESWGSLAPLAFIGFQALQVVLAPFPGEFTGAVGGFIFGGFPTIFYSTLGLAIGASIAFMAARVMGYPLVQAVATERQLRRFSFLAERRGTAVAFVLFLIPGFPKDVLSYILGLSPMRFRTFFLVCTFGRIPGTVLLSFSGSALYEENWLLLGITTVLALLLIGLVYAYRERIERWFRSSERESNQAYSAGGAQSEPVTPSHDAT